MAIEVDQSRSQARRSWWAQQPALKRLLKLVVAAVVVAGIAGVVQPAIAPPVAQAVVVQGPDKVGWGRAALLFNRDETLKIGTGGLVNVPPAGPIGAAFALAKAGLAVIALNYYNRGGCVSLSWPQGDGLNWLPLCGRRRAGVTV